MDRFAAELAASAGSENQLPQALPQTAARDQTIPLLPRDYYDASTSNAVAGPSSSMSNTSFGIAGDHHHGRLASSLSPASAPASVPTASTEWLDTASHSDLVLENTHLTTLTDRLKRENVALKRENYALKQQLDFQQPQPFGTVEPSSLYLPIPPPLQQQQQQQFGSLPSLPPAHGLPLSSFSVPRFGAETSGTRFSDQEAVNDQDEIDELDASADEEEWARSPKKKQRLSEPRPWMRKRTQSPSPPPRPASYAQRRAEIEAETSGYQRPELTVEQIERIGETNYKKPGRNFRHECVVDLEGDPVSLDAALAARADLVKHGILRRVRPADQDAEDLDLAVKYLEYSCPEMAYCPATGKGQKYKALRYIRAGTQKVTDTTATGRGARTGGGKRKGAVYVPAEKGSRRQAVPAESSGDDASEPAQLDRFAPLPPRAARPRRSLAEAASDEEQDLSSEDEKTDADEEDEDAEFQPPVAATAEGTDSDLTSLSGEDEDDGEE